MALTVAAGQTSDRRWQAPVAVAAVAAGAVGVAAVRDPFHPGAWPVCPFHAATGWYCPFCGCTRALYALAHGHPGLMAANNALLPLWLLLALWGWLWWLSKLQLVPGWIQAPARSRIFRFALPTVLVVFWVGRNLPGLQTLAPHGHL